MITYGLMPDWLYHNWKGYKVNGNSQDYINRRQFYGRGCMFFVLFLIGVLVYVGGFQHNLSASIVILWPLSLLTIVFFLVGCYFLSTPGLGKDIRNLCQTLDISYRELFSFSMLFDLAPRVEQKLIHSAALLKYAEETYGRLSRSANQTRDAFKAAHNKCDRFNAATEYNQYFDKANNVKLSDRDFHYLEMIEHPHKGEIIG